MKCKCGHDEKEHGAAAGACYHFSLGEFCRCDLFKRAPKPRRRAPAFRRWSVAESVPVVECGVGGDEWVQVTVATMARGSDILPSNMRAARALCRELNRARVVLPAEVRTEAKKNKERAR